MTASETERLRSENDMLRRQLLRAGVAPASPMDLPDDDQTDQLIALVAKRWPVLAPPAGAVARAGYEEEFHGALYFLAHARRRAEPDTGAYTSYWISGCERFLSERGWPSTITGKSFCAAAIASRVAHAPLTRFPFDLAWGLSLGTGRPSAEWRQTLLTGKLLEPVKVEQPRATEPLPVTIRGGGNGVGRISNYYTEGDPVSRYWNGE
jgi:hypothetical protein